MLVEKDFEWFKNKTVYQIWPRSFCDSNGDGVGDIQGIISKLDYLKALGIEIIWLSPIYSSPMDDMGYDIADYYRVDPLFGSDQDFDELVTEAKQRNIHIVMDLVVNHTSDEHFWFQEALKGPDNPYRDYYIWHDPVAGGPPTAQRSFFLPSAWSYEPKSAQYYYHAFSTRQPDLNWDNPKILEEVYQIMNFWLAKGVAGFRMDVIELIGKVPLESKLTSPRAHELLKLIFKHTLANYPRTFSVGETGGATVADAILYSGARDELDMVFCFEHLAQDEVAGHGKWQLQPLDLVGFKRVFAKWQQGLFQRGWNSLYLGNHDQPRPVSRWGNDGEFRVVSAKMLANTLHMMQGTPYIYQGEEIGMTNCQFATPDELRDVEAINFYREFIADPAWGAAKVNQALQAKGRDNARTPVQWNAEAYAGFSSVEPWIKLNPNYSAINVADALQDPNSIWYFYQQLIQLRQEYPIIVEGDFELIAAEHPQIFAYRRSYAGQELYVISNFSAESLSFSAAQRSFGKLLISNYPQADELDLAQLNLRPYESVTLWFERT